MLKYPARHYDENLKLKVSPLLWLSLLYAIRHFFIYKAVSLMPFEVGAIAWLNLQAQVIFMWCDLPALLVLIATGHRVPNALRVMRWVWLHGKTILSISYLLSLCSFIYLNVHLLSTPNTDESLFAVVIVMTDVAVLIWLWRSSLVSDIFAEFPDTFDEKSEKQPPKTVSSERLLLLKIQHQKQRALLEVAVLSNLPSVAFEITPDATPQSGLETAAVFEAKNQLSEAEWVYRALLARWPDCADAWHAFGLLAYQADKREHGIALVEEAMRLDGKSGMYRRNICEMYRRMGKLQEAIRYGQVACRLSLEDAEAWHYLGLALTNAQRLEEAIAAYRKVVALEPSHVQCWNNLGVALQLAGNRKEAEQAYRNAMKIMPEHEGASRNLQSLDIVSDGRKVNP